MRAAKFSKVDRSIKSSIKFFYTFRSTNIRCTPRYSFK